MNQKTAFVIMPFGVEEMETVYRLAIAPAIVAAGLRPQRVDKHGEGGLVKTDIIRMIDEAEMIVADVTGARPNCYLEVGLVMGKDKYKRLILSVREDHLPGSPGYDPGRAKLHFDLAGYNVTSWAVDSLTSFRESLQKEIVRRMDIVTDVLEVKHSSGSVLTDEWFANHHRAARQGLEKAQLRGAVEYRFYIEALDQDISPPSLLTAAQRACQPFTGLPIGSIFPENERIRPRPTADGGFVSEFQLDSCSYDYFAASKRGMALLVRSFDETRTRATQFLYDEQIAQLAEALLFSTAFARQLHASESAIIHFQVQFLGTNGRLLHVSSDSRSTPLIRHMAAVEPLAQSTRLSIGAVDGNLVDVVQSLMDPTLAMFDFFQLSSDRYRFIVERAVRRRI